jgi:hypothetical protein
MKKIFLFLALFFLLTFVYKTEVVAQVNNFLVPGVNCGIAGDIKTSKCCAPVKFNPLQLPDFGAPFNTLGNLIMGPGLNFLKTLTNPIEDYQSKIVIPCQVGKASTSDSADVNCRCTFDGLTPTPGPIDALLSYCDNLTTKGEPESCKTCVNSGGIWSGLGCVKGDLRSFISETIFGWGIGLAGGFALLCIIYAAFMMQSSQGNPEKLKKAQELITSCIMGLMLIIFSVFILRLIGVNILKIPGFT